MPEKSALDTALALLARRDHAVEEMRSKLLARRFSEQEAGEAIRVLVEKGYLDDARFAELFSRSAVGSRRAFGERLVQELRRRGVNRELAREAAEAAGATIDPDEEIRSLVARRFPGIRSGGDGKELRRMVAFLQRKGFELPTILRILREEQQ